MNDVKGIKRIVNATRYSWQGFKAAWRGEEAFRQELLLVLVMIPVAIWLGTNAVERSLLIGCLLLLLIVEMLNSAVEAVTDRVGTERHELSGKAKDMGSAAVLLALINVAVVWGLIAYQRFIA
ncbi:MULTISPECIES: diacylglycerol kinase [Corallincola]|uniref:Diacylglycerol kinase n=2 Tax=Corallincola TaxID=1775176 RepID=A0ABY1WV99_9GAMM|nr:MULTISPECIES: diacylglycerol kinase [Corallincola]TAA48686.1 diacylglycerol kinase [Corallincola spongiicola]TCI05455.1 diacylglycerol kinase [Corallincola luteus]